MEEAVVKRIMPHSIEAEQAVIGAMIMDREAISTSMEIVLDEDFYQKQYGIIFSAIVELFNKGIPVDLVTLQEALQQKDVPPEISSPEFLANLSLSVETSANVKYYATIVHDKAVMRNLIRANDEISNTCYAGKEDLETVLEKAEKSIFSISQSQGNDDIQPIKEIVMNALTKIETVSKSKGVVTGVPTGFTQLDAQTAGMQPSDLVLIAARPSMGKTAFVLNIAQYVAFKKKKSVGIFSLEMPKELLINRFFALQSNVDAQKIRTGELADDEWDRLVESATEIGKSKLMIDDTPGITIQKMRSLCRKMKMENGLDMVIVDYLQLMETKERHSSQQDKINAISRSLKALARELNVPVLALSQLNRSVEQRENKRPMPSDLRDSGAIEQDADVIMFIYRDDYYNKDSDKKGIAEIIVAKQRNGPTGTVELAWLPEFTKFANPVIKKRD